MYYLKLTEVISKTVSTTNQLTFINLPTFALKYSKDYLRRDISQITCRNYYKLLPTTDGTFVSVTQSELYPNLDSALYGCVSKSIPSTIMKILNPTSPCKSGVSILYHIKQEAYIPCSHDEIDSIYKSWYNIKHGQNKSIKDYTARAVQFKIDLSNSYESLGNEEFIR